MFHAPIVFVPSIVLFIIALSLFFIKRKSAAFIIRFSFFWVIITLIIIELFFPLYYQKEAVDLNSNYTLTMQSFAFFPAFTKAMKWVSQEGIFNCLRFYLTHAVIPAMGVGLILGILIRLNLKTWKIFFAVSAGTCIGIECLKLLLCVSLNSWYLTITTEDCLYLFLGCIIGALILSIIRKILVRFHYENRVMNGFQQTLFQKAKRKPAIEGNDIS